MPTRRRSRPRRAIRLALALSPAVGLVRGEARAQVLDLATRPGVRRSTAAVLAGVVSDTGGVPVPGASVVLDGGRGQAITDSSGRFALHGLLPGPVGATVRRIGFVPADFELDLPAGTRVEVTATLLVSPSRLPTIVVDGERRELVLYANGFYDRQRTANGRFLGPEFLDPRAGVPLSMVLREVPRVQMQCSPTGTRCEPFVGIGRLCAPRVWLDGFATLDGVLDEVVPRSRVRAIEVYASAAFVPGEFATPGDTCGAIAVWTEMAPTWSRLLPRRRLQVPRPDDATGAHDA